MAFAGEDMELGARQGRGKVSGGCLRGAASGGRAVARGQCQVGIGHVVTISAQLAALDPPVSFGIPHLQVERAPRAKPVTWTLLRPTMFVQTLRMFASDLARCQRLIAPMGRGAIAFVDARDIAAVAVAALLGNDLAGCTLTLTGPEVVTCGQVAAMLSERLGHHVRYLSPPMALARWKLRAEHPRGHADCLADGVAALQVGGHSQPTSDVPGVLGRPARTVGAFLDEQLPRPLPGTRVTVACQQDQGGTRVAR